MSHIRSRKHPAPSHLIALMAVAVPIAVHAQEAETTLPAMTVTADAVSNYKADTATSTKYTAPLVDTPKTVTVVTQEVMQQTNASTLEEALRTVPGITFGHGEGGNPSGDLPVIRGFSAASNMYIDGLRDPGAQSRNMFAIEQVDVVKGPDSAFSGGGAVGGSINMATKSAKLGNFNEVSVGLGTDKYIRGSADFNRQLTDSVAVRLNLLKEKGDTPGRNEVDYDNTGANLSAAFGLGTPTRATVDFYHYKTSGQPDYGVPYNNPYSGADAVFNGDGGPLGVNRDNYYGIKGRDFKKTNTDSFSVKFEHDLNDKWTIRNATRYTKTESDYVASNPGDSRGLNTTNHNITINYTDANGVARVGTVLPGQIWRSQKSHNREVDAWVNDTQLSGEFETAGVKHNVVLGFDISRVESDIRGYTVNGFSVGSINNPNPDDPWTGSVNRATSGNTLTTTMRGIYAFDTLTLSKQWLANLGVRHDSFRSKVNNYTTNNTAPTAANLETNSSFNSYQAGVVYKPLDNGSIYFNYATGANPSGISVGGEALESVSATNKDLEPEKVRSYELGTKWNLLNNKLALSAAFFKMEKTNAKVTVATNVLATVGSQEIQGYELGFAGALTDKWQLAGGYTHMDSKLADPGPLSADKGKKFPNTPEDSFSLWTSYMILPKLTIGAGANYVSKTYGNTANTKWAPSYWLFNAMASYDVTKQFGLRLNVKNLTDKTYYSHPYATHMVDVGPGRQVILTANYKF